MFLQKCRNLSALFFGITKDHRVTRLVVLKKR
jgi:hypothetical protein